MGILCKYGLIGPAEFGWFAENGGTGQVHASRYAPAGVGTLQQLAPAHQVRTVVLISNALFNHSTQVTHSPFAVQVPQANATLNLFLLFDIRMSLGPTCRNL